MSWDTFQQNLQGTEIRGRLLLLIKQACRSILLLSGQNESPVGSRPIDLAAGAEKDPIQLAVENPGWRAVHEPKEARRFAFVYLRQEALRHLGLSAKDFEGNCQWRGLFENGVAELICCRR
jgi:hypothetical protein